MPSIFGSNATSSTFTYAEVLKRISQSRASSRIKSPTSPAPNSAQINDTSTPSTPAMHVPPVYPSTETMSRASTAPSSQPAESTASPVPADVKADTTSVTSKHRAITVKTQNRGQLTAKETKALRENIIDTLRNDLAAVKGAAKAARAHPKWTMWTSEQQEERVQKLVTDKIEERIASGKYVSCTYLLFKGYVPVLTSRRGRDYDKLRLVDAQVAAMKCLTVEETAREEEARRVRDRDQEDDEEDLSSFVKREPLDLAQEPNDSPLLDKKQDVSNAKDSVKQSNPTATTTSQRRTYLGATTADKITAHEGQSVVGKAFVRGMVLPNTPTTKQDRTTADEPKEIAFVRGLCIEDKRTVNGMEWVQLRGWLPMFASEKLSEPSRGKDRKRRRDVEDEGEVNVKKAKVEDTDW